MAGRKFAAGFEEDGNRPLHQRAIALQAEHHTSILERERGQRQSQQQEELCDSHGTPMLPGVRRERQHRADTGEYGAREEKEQQELRKIVDPLDPPPTELTTRTPGRSSPADSPNPPDDKNWNVYMGSVGVQNALHAQLDSREREVEAKGAAGFMSAMSELRPGLSEFQKKRAKEQQETLRNQLAQQVVEKKEREAKEKAERIAREKQEEEEIRAYHEKLRKREEQEKLRKCKEIREKEEENRRMLLAAKTVQAKPASRIHARADREERVVGMAGSLPTKQQKPDGGGAYQVLDPMAREAFACSTVENRGPSPVPSLASSVRSFEVGGGGGLPRNVEESTYFHRQLNQVNKEQVRARQEITRMGARAEDMCHRFPPTVPVERIQNARELVRNTHAFLAARDGAAAMGEDLEGLRGGMEDDDDDEGGGGEDEEGDDDDEEVFYFATSHLLPRSAAQIPDELPAPHATEVCKVRNEGMRRRRRRRQQKENDEVHGSAPRERRARVRHPQNYVNSDKDHAGGRRVGHAKANIMEMGNQEVLLRRRAGEMPQPIRRAVHDMHNEMRDKGYPAPAKRIWRV